MQNKHLHIFPYGLKQGFEGNNIASRIVIVLISF